MFIHQNLHKYTKEDFAGNVFPNIQFFKMIFEKSGLVRHVEQQIKLE